MAEKLKAIGGNAKTTGEDEDDLSVSRKEKTTGEDTSGNDEEKQSHLFPTAFYCPITKELFERPVVAPDGDSYELSAVEEEYEPASLYENRALQEVIKEVKKTKTNISDTNDFETSLRNMQNNIKTNLKNLVDRSAFTPNWLGPLPDAYYCPITLDLMYRPVIDAEGTTYDRRAIVKWLRVNGKSPFSRKELKKENLYPNNVIRDLIHSELDKSDESIHPSVRKWKSYHQKQQQQASGSDHENWDDDSDDDDSSLPVTEEQIDERRHEERRRRRRYLHLTVVYCFMLLLLFYFLPYVFFMFSFFFSVCFIINYKRNA